MVDAPDAKTADAPGGEAASRGPAGGDWAPPRRLTAWCQAMAEDGRFQSAVIAVIVMNAILMGLETSPHVVANYGALSAGAGVAVQTIFVVEMAIRLLASRPLTRFFRDGWNVFDFSVVMVSLLPAVGPLATVARLARVLRVARLVSVSPDLRLIIATMLRSIPSMGHVVLLLSLLLYVYAILGFQWFGAQDPAHWGTLGTALLSLFQVLTLEGWPEMQKAVMVASPWAWLYFASFVIIAVFVVINLFIAVVINNLQTIKAEDVRDSRAAVRGEDLVRCIDELRTQLDHLEATLREHTDVSKPHPSSGSGGREPTPAA